VSYFNREQEAHMDELARIPLDQKCFCGWYRLGQCPNCTTRLSCADKCLPCRGVGKRWVPCDAEPRYQVCPDCKGSGLKERTHAATQANA